MSRVIPLRSQSRRGPGGRSPERARLPQVVRQAGLADRRRAAYGSRSPRLRSRVGAAAGPTCSAQKRARFHDRSSPRAGWQRSSRLLDSPAARSATPDLRGAAPGRWPRSVGIGSGRRLSPCRMERSHEEGLPRLPRPSGHRRVRPEGRRCTIGTSTSTRRASSRQRQRPARSRKRFIPVTRTRARARSIDNDASDGELDCRVIALGDRLEGWRRFRLEARSRLDRMQPFVEM